MRIDPRPDTAGVAPQCSAPDSNLEPDSSPLTPSPRQPAPVEPYPYCECARFGKRSLSWAVWISGASGDLPGSLLDRRNLEFSHEHLKFDQSGDNLGFGPHGIFSEDVSQYEYRWETTCYDGAAMRETLKSFSAIGTYNFFRNNCQDFAARLRDYYNRLRRV